MVMSLADSSNDYDSINRHRAKSSTVCTSPFDFLPDAGGLCGYPLVFAPRLRSIQ